MIGWASASTRWMTGSSTSSGSSPRTRLTRSRTSFVASLLSRPSRKVTVIWLASGRLIDDVKSTPSIPAMDSSRTCVTWVSTTSELAPVIGRLDVDHRRIDVGIFADRQVEIADRPDQQDQQAHNRRQHRPADGYVREDHLPAPFAASTTMTGAPLRSF